MTWYHHAWSERFDRRLTDIFAIQGEIARAIAPALKVELAGRESLEPRRVPDNSGRW